MNNPLVWGGVVLTLSTLLYLLFKDTMNRVQYVERLSLYWIIRDNGDPGSHLCVRAFMRQTSAPFWRGKGVQFRIGKYTLQVGRLLMRVDSLESQVGSGFYDYSPKDIRKWTSRATPR